MRQYEFYLVGQNVRILTAKSRLSRMRQVMQFLAHICMLLCAIVNVVEARTADEQQFCNCIENRNSNWETGRDAGVCFGNSFLEKGKNETCNPEVDPAACKAQRLYNLALAYVTDLKSIDKYVGVRHNESPEGDLKNNLYSMIEKYNSFIKYHPIIMQKCGSSEWNKRDILEALSTFDDFRKEYSRDRGRLPNAVAITKAFFLGKQLQREVDKVCDDDPSEDFCMEMRQMHRIISKMEDLLENAYSFPPDVRTEVTEAYSLNFVPFILKDPGYTRIQPSNEETRKRLYEKFTERLVSYTVNKDLERLQRLMRFLPGYEDMRDCSTYANGDYCIFRSATDQLSQYLSRRKARLATREKADGLKFSLKSYIDYRSYMKNFWKQAVLDKLRSSSGTFKLVEEFLVDEIKEKTGKRMDELKDYFYQVEGYNNKIASADIAYLEGMMHRAAVGFSKSRTTVKQLTEELEEKVYTITISSLWWDFFGLGVSIATTALDIRKWVQGNAISDLVDAANDLLATGANLREIDVMDKKMMETQKIIYSIAQKLNANDDFLRVVKKILPSSELNVSSEEFNHAKKEFLKKYVDYSPQVRLAEITRVGELVNNIIDQLCALIDEGRGPWAYVEAGMLHYEGKCFKLMSAVSTMTSYNEQLYEFQFEYMDALAEYMRSATATVASREINADLFHRTTSPSLTRLRSMTVGAFFTHEMQKWEIMEDYCDVLEYRDGGLRPAICKELSADFPALLAYKPKECDSDVEQIVDIPAQENTSGKNPDASAIYLSDLISGKPVTLQVPNTDWLIKNKWITEKDANSAIFVKNFELFIPAQHRPTRKIRTEVTAAINRLYPGGPIYGINPAAVFVTEYEVGKADLGCRMPLIDNPYTTCKSRRLPKICERTQSNNADNFQTMTKYPSVFARWSIQAFGYERYNVEKYATPFTIKAKVQLCKIRDRIPATYYEKPTEGDDDGSAAEPDEDADTKDEVSSQTTWGCCYENTYFNATANECKECPSNSNKGMGGYACFY